MLIVSRILKSANVQLGTREEQNLRGAESYMIIEMPAQEKLDQHLVDVVNKELRFL